MNIMNLKLKENIGFEEFKSQYEKHIKGERVKEINFKAKLKQNENEINLMSSLTILATIINLFFGDLIKDSLKSIIVVNSELKIIIIIFIILVAYISILTYFFGRVLSRTRISKKVLYFIEKIEEEEYNDKENKIDILLSEVIKLKKQNQRRELELEKVAIELDVLVKSFAKYGKKKA